MSISELLFRLNLLMQQAEYEQAWRLGRQALEQAPTQPELQVILGYLCLEHPLGAQGAGLEPAEILAEASAALLRMQQLSQAADFLQQALNRFPGEPALLWQLGQLWLRQGDWRAAQRLIAELYQRRQEPLPEQPGEGPARALSIFPYELEHHLAQLRYLLTLGVLSPAYTRLQALWQALWQTLQDHPPFQPVSLCSSAVAWLKRDFYTWPLPSFETLLNPRLDTQALETAFLQAPGVPVVIDQLLRPEVFQSLQAYFLGSTFWLRAYATGYLGVSWRTGLHAALLFQLAEELRQAFPRIFEAHALQNMWALSCDARGQRAAVHGDEAALNFNFWLTPSEANREPGRGGLIVYDQPIPDTWRFSQLNQAYHLPQIYAYLRQTGAVAHQIPYRQNRAVIFRGNLLHETDHFHFQSGFCNQRKTLVMLFGERQPWKMALC